MPIFWPAEAPFTSIYSRTDAAVPWRSSHDPHAHNVVVRHGHAPVFVQRDLDFLAKARHRFVDRVVDDFMDKVVQAPAVNGPDVHRGPFSDRLEALQHLDLLGVVGGLFYHLIRNLLRRASWPSRSPSREMLRVYDGSV